mmetsp:Transcript_19831/g.25706  ORF Transcript_19831/g.25706 Transcript_19831/m.25706 type:complete len:292 (-) Transcript_19831:2632-3507(-)
MNESESYYYCKCCNGERRKKYPHLSSLYQHCRAVHKDFISFSKYVASHGDAPSPELSSIAYEDDFFAVVNKDQGVETGKINSEMKLILNFLKRPDKKLIKTAKEIYTLPLPVHRLDKETGGLVVFAKTKSVSAILSEAFKNRLIEKTYRAVVFGDISIESLENVENLSDEGAFKIISPVGGKEATTHCRIVSKHAYRSPKRQRGDPNGDTIGKSQIITKVELKPKTGRTHQLRKHMKLIGFPILGDKRYGGTEVFECGDRRLHLYAVRLRFDHPTNGSPIEVAVTEPQYFP